MLRLIKLRDYPDQNPIPSNITAAEKFDPVNKGYYACCDNTFDQSANFDYCFSVGDTCRNPSKNTIIKPVLFFPS